MVHGYSTVSVVLRSRLILWFTIQWILIDIIDIFLWDFNRECMGHTLSSYPSKNDFTVHSFLLKIFLNDSTYRPCPQPFHFATSSPQRLPKFDLKFSETCIFSINSTEAIKLTINRDNKTSFGIKVLLNRFFKNLSLSLVFLKILKNSNSKKVQSIWCIY